MALASLGLAAVPAMEWNVDVPHSGIDFGVKHFFTPVRGSFEEYEAVLFYDRRNPEESSVRVRIDVASVNTASERRDQHLLSADFFEAERHPHITFESREVEAVSDTELRVRGPLTIEGVTREVELPVTLLGHREVPADMPEMPGGDGDRQLRDRPHPGPAGLRGGRRELGGHRRGRQRGGRPDRRGGEPLTGTVPAGRRSDGGGRTTARGRKGGPGSRTGVRASPG